MNLQELLPRFYRSSLILLITLLTFTSTYAQAPVNDDCSGAITLSVDTICSMDTFDNFNATASAGVANPTCGFYQGGDVWFKVTVPSSGNIRFEVRNVSGINPQFALYSGSCGSLTQYSCNQLNADRTISDPSLANQTLYIRVYKYNNASGGTFQICVWEPPVPPNNNCADAIMMNVGTSCNKVAYTSLYSTGEPTSVAPNPSCGFYQGGDVWFKFVMPASGVVRFELTGQAPQYAVYSGSCGSFTQVSCAQLNAETMLVDTTLAGDTLYLRTYRYNSEEGGNFDICIWEPDIPANDNCGDAIMLNVGTVCNKDTFTNAYATAQPTSVAPNPTCGFYKGGDVWFKFVAPASGIFRVEAKGFGMNAQYAVFSGSCGSFTQEMCAQLDAGKTVINPSLGSDTLYLRVYNYNNEEGGDFEICVWEPPIPINDNCADAIWLNAGTSCNMDTFTNAYASAEATSIAPNPSCGFYKGGDVWFKFKMPASGNLRVDRVNMGNNAQFAVYSGSCGTFTQLFCAQLDAGKTFIDTTVAGDTLYLRVFNYNNDDGGAFSLCVWEPPIPVNNNCANALPLTVGASCVPTNFTNRYSTSEATSIAPNPSCGFYRGADVWFTVQVPSSGLLTIQRQNLNGVNAQMALYSGSCGSFSQLACAQLNSTLNFADTTYIGQTLHLRIFSYNNDEGGEFNLCAFNPSPAVIAQSNDTTICQGNNAYFSVTATNATNYQWQENDGNGWINISNGGVYSGTTTATLNFTNVPASMNGYQYQCVVTGIVSPPDISSVVTLTVGTPALFQSGPSSVPAYTSASTCNAIASYVHTVTGVPTPYVSYSFSGATSGSGPGTGSGKYFQLGNTTVVITASNSCGTDTTELTVSVTDTIKPVIYCSANVSVNTDSGSCTASNVVLSQPSVNDACGIDTIYNNAPATYPIGTTTVTWTATDNNGNTATCEQDITVTDTIPPIIMCSSNITLSTDTNSCIASNVSLTQPAATDACGIDTIFNNAPANFPLGNTTVTWTATDNNGVSSTCEQIITVVDDIKPTINCGADLTISTDSGICSANSVVLTTPTGTDNCASSVTFTSNAPNSYGVGTTQVIWTGSDNNGNSSTCTQYVTVIDTTAPTITCPAGFTVPADSGLCTASGVIINAPSVFDGCGIDTIFTNEPPTYSYGATIVTITATDNNGNSSTCSTTVNVTDTQPPVISSINDLFVFTDSNSCSASNVILPVPNVTDNCGVDSVWDDAPPVFPLGNTTVTVTATDFLDQQTTQTYNVNVKDNTPPTVEAGPDFTIGEAGNCNVPDSLINWGSRIIINDNCSIDTTYSNAPQFYGLGTTSVIWTTVDGSGNTTTDTVQVTVIDTTAPVITCPTNITVNADNGTCVATGVNLGTPTVNDNCSTSLSNNAPSSYPVGTTNVLWTATDNSNNSASCVQTVTVVDNQSPNAVCKNHTITLVNGSATISVGDINNGSSDNCGIDTMYLSQTSFNTSHIGNNTVTLTVVDINGNTSTCTAIVTVQGGGNSNLSCNLTVTPANNTYTGGNPNNIYLGYGPQTVTLTASVTGGSGGYTYSWTGTNTNCNNCGNTISVVPASAGTYVFTLTVTDNNNNTTTCNTSICVKDIRVSGKKNKNKVYICHNGKTINISVNAVAAHLNNHNDFLGKCEDNSCNAAAKGGKINDNESVVSNMHDIADNSSGEFKLFPNPNEGTFKIQMNDEIAEGQLIVMDMLGKVVKRITIDNNSNMTFSMPDVADGVYMIELKNGTNVYRKRMVIKR